MPKLKLESLRAGMVVTADVKNMDGMLLIPSGATLSENQIDTLNAWGIAEVQVAASDHPTDVIDVLETLPMEALERLIDEVKSRFWEPTDKHAVQAEAFSLALRREAKRRAAKPASTSCH